MAEPAKNMSQQPPKKLLARSGETITEARIMTGDSNFIFGPNQPMYVGEKGSGTRVEAMALHPSGLVVVPLVGPHRGKRIVVPGARVEYAVVAESEQ